LLAAIAALRSDVGPVPEMAAPAATAERRQLTVMFCDLVGSTALSVRRDPEDLRDLIAAYHRTVADVVKRFEGFVARYMGDGILIYFGYPRAQEDDAERAARCALAVEAISGLKPRRRASSTHRHRHRYGGRRRRAPAHDVVGDAKPRRTFASLAEPNAVLIDENTRRLIGGLFEYRDLGAVEARGFLGTVSAWQVLRPSAVVSRFEALRASSPAPLGGLSEELQLLLRRWERAKKADGQVVLLSGEPGIGKSRMTAALAERLGEEPHYHLRYFCAPHHQGTALYPIITQLEHAASFARDDPPAAKLGETQAALWARAPRPPAAARRRSCGSAVPQQRAGGRVVAARGRGGAASTGRGSLIAADRGSTVRDEPFAAAEEGKDTRSVGRPIGRSESSAPSADGV
jgi:class 3 adenylate cyclase